MSKTNFTPGPWCVDEDWDEFGIVFRYDFTVKTETETICFHTTDNAADTERLRANANLIAAAPTMYACLDGVKKVLEIADFGIAVGGTPLTDMIEKALKKARGEV